MLAHNAHIDPKIFLTTFIDGLKDEIRVVVTIQQPLDLDTTGSFEEVLESIKPKENKWWATQIGPSISVSLMLTLL
jgi:hypothetical protein